MDNVRVLIINILCVFVLCLFWCDKVVVGQSGVRVLLVEWGMDVLVEFLWNMELSLISRLTQGGYVSVLY